MSKIYYYGSGDPANKSLREYFNDVARRLLNIGTRISGVHFQLKKLTGEGLTGSTINSVATMLPAGTTFTKGVGNTDKLGRITINVNGISSNSSGILFKYTYEKTQDTIPIVFLSPGNSSAADIMSEIYVSESFDGFTVYKQAGQTFSGTLILNFFAPTL